jgi:hypothetical protein
MAPLRWLADENFNNDVTRALIRHRPNLDIIRAQDAGLDGKSDPEVLEWAATENRVVLTHDVSTMTMYAFNRIEARESMPGVWESSRHVSIAQAVQDILLLTDCSFSGEWEGQVRYLPLR